MNYETEKEQIEQTETIETIEVIEKNVENENFSSEFPTVENGNFSGENSTVGNANILAEHSTVENKNILPEIPTVANAKKQFVKESSLENLEFLDSDYKWYCVRTYTGHEVRIKQTIEAEITRLGLQSLIREIVVPLETVFEVRKGKRKTKIRNFLPGYIVIKAVISEEKKTKNKVLDIVEGITGVVAFVGRKNHPAPLQESEVERIFGRVAERAGIETIECTYSKGDPIKVIEGPFGGFSGTVLEVNNEKQKVKVEIVILGRKTPVELDFEQIQFDKPE